MKICIIIPMYNEEPIAKLSVESILAYTKKLPGMATLLVVNDGSADCSGEIVQEIMDEVKDSEKLHLIEHERNKGYGSALRTGMEYAIQHEYDYVLFMDSDLTNHPKYLIRFYEKMNEGWDYIKATRYSKGGDIADVPWQHKIISQTGNLIAKILFRLPISDFTNGFRAVKVDVLKKMNLKENGFVIIMEELQQAKALTKSFCEVPYILTARGEGQGVTRLSYGPKMCMKYLKYALKSAC